MSESPDVQIARIERIKTGQYAIYMDNGQELRLHEDVLIRHGLSKGKRLDVGQLGALEAEELVHGAYRLALGFMGARPRSAAEVRKKLAARSIGASVIAEVIRKLTDQGILDDHAFAENLSEQRMLGQKKGRKWAAYELRQKGVDNALIRDALEKIDEEAEYAAALQLAMKKWRVSTGDAGKKSEKTVSFLLRRGYDNGIVARVLREIRRQMPENGDDWQTFDGFAQPNSDD